MRGTSSGRIAFFFMVLEACMAGAPPVEEMTVDLPPPQSASAVARAPTEFAAGTTGVPDERSSTPRSSITNAVPVISAFSIPAASGVIPPIVFPGLFPPGAFPSAASVPTSTTQPLSKQSEARLALDLRKAVFVEAPGTSPMSTNVSGKFQAITAPAMKGDILVAPVLLEPGKCYSFVAVTRDRVDVSLELQMDFPGGLPLPMPPLAVAKGAGPRVAFGGGGNCFKMPIPMPLPARLIVSTSGPAEVMIGIVAK